MKLDEIDFDEPPFIPPPLGLQVTDDWETCHDRLNHMITWLRQAIHKNPWLQVGSEYHEFAS